MTADSARPGRRRRWVIAGLLVVSVGAWLAVRALLRHERAHRLAREIKLQGGEVILGPSVLDNVPGWWSETSPVRWKAGTRVTLFGVHLDTVWLRDHDDLTDLSIVELYLDRSSLATEDALRLIDRHPLQKYFAGGQRDADSVAAALANKPSLTGVVLHRSDLTDEGLRRLPLEQLERLRVEGAHVTSSGLGEVRRCRRLEEVTMDGDQLDESVVAMLAELPNLKYVGLVGEDIRDDNVQLIAALQKLPFLELYRTSVTNAGVEKLKHAMPGTVVKGE